MNQSGRGTGCAVATDDLGWLFPRAIPISPPVVSIDKNDGFARIVALYGRDSTLNYGEPLSYCRARHLEINRTVAVKVKL